MSEATEWVRPTNVNANVALGVNNSIQKSAGAINTWNAGAVSHQFCNSGDCYIELIVAETNTQREVGLSAFATALILNTSITIGVTFTAAATYTVQEAGVNKTVAAAYAAADVFRIAIESGVFKVRKNGTVVWTSALTPAYPIRGAFAGFTLNATSGATVVDSMAKNPVYYKLAWVLPRVIRPYPAGLESGQIFP